MVFFIDLPRLLGWCVSSCRGSIEGASSVGTKLHEAGILEGRLPAGSSVATLAITLVVTAAHSGAHGLLVTMSFVG